MFGTCHRGVVEAGNSVKMFLGTLSLSFRTSDSSASLQVPLLGFASQVLNSFLPVVQ